MSKGGKTDVVADGDLALRPSEEVRPDLTSVAVGKLHPPERGVTANLVYELNGSMLNLLLSLSRAIADDYGATLVLGVALADPSGAISCQCGSDQCESQFYIPGSSRWSQ